jgi:hypothetical protein
MSKPQHNRVTKKGIALGAQTARLAQAGVDLLLRDGELDERCKSCAFRVGTVPNGCPQTQIDVLKAVAEGVRFNCHQADRKGEVCHGWYASRVAMRQAAVRRRMPMPYLKCPWPFSPPDDAEPPK